MPVRSPAGRRHGSIEIDALDLDSPRMLDANVGPVSEDGVSAVHIRVDASAGRCRGLAPERHRQPRAGIFRLLRGLRESPTAGHHVVSWLPFYHDMGLLTAALLRARSLAGTPGRADESDVVFAETGPVDAVAGHQ